MTFQWIKDLKNPTDIYAAQLPLLKLMVWSGLLPVKLSGSPGDRKLMSSWLGLINTFIHILSFIACYVYTIIHHKSIIGHFFRNDIFCLGDYLQLVAQLVTIVVTYSFSAFRREKFCKIIHKLADVDSFANEICINADYKSTLKYIFLVLLYKTCIVGSYIVGTLYIFFKKGIRPTLDVWITFFFPLLMITLLVALYTCIMSQIKHRFYLLNRILRSHADGCPQIKTESGVVLIKKRSFGITSSINPSNYLTMNHEQTIQASAQIHHALCDICDVAENYFTQMLLTIITIGFLIIIFNMYYILELLFATDKRNAELQLSKYDFITFFLYQSLVFWMAIVCIVYFSSSVVKQSEEVGVWIHKILSQGVTDTIRMMLIQFSLQLTHRKVQFTACGLFVLDKHLLFTIIGTATTYLVILIQFSISEDTTMKKWNASMNSENDIQNVEGIFDLSSKLLDLNKTFGNRTWTLTECVDLLNFSFSIRSM